MATINFNPASVEPQQNFSALPAGRYCAEITDSEMKATKAGTGEYLQLTFTLTDNESGDGRKVWTCLNLSNPNKTAEGIAQRELSAICHCLGFGDRNISESEELHNIPLYIDVIQERNPVTESIANRIKGYAPLEKAVRVAKGAEKFSSPAAPAVRKNPWGK